jgi:hypothetical protein
VSHFELPKILAERQGFEPWVKFYPHNRLAGGCLRPTRPPLLKRCILTAAFMLCKEKSCVSPGPTEGQKHPHSFAARVPSSDPPGGESPAVAGEMVPKNTLEGYRLFRVQMKIAEPDDVAALLGDYLVNDRFFLYRVPYGVEIEQRLLLEPEGQLHGVGDRLHVFHRGK